MNAREFTLMERTPTSSGRAPKGVSPAQSNGVVDCKRGETLAEQIVHICSGLLLFQVKVVYRFCPHPAAGMSGGVIPLFLQMYADPHLRAGTQFRIAQNPASGGSHA